MLPSAGGPRNKVVLKGLGVVAFFCIVILLLMSSFPHKRPGANLNLPLRILPLGDSITWGGQPGADNGTDGYRAQLIHALIRARYASVNFVGTQRSGLMPNNDNEGHPGATISELQGLMKAGLQMRPNLVLLHIGTNDLARPETAEEKWADAPKRLAALLDDVLDVCPDAAVLVAKIIQGADTQAQENIKRFNDAVPAVVKKKLDQGFKVAVVDHSVVLPEELVDGVHPSYSGYFHMGNIWFDAVKAASGLGVITPPVALHKT